MGDDIPPEVRERIENNGSMDAEEALGEFDRRSIAHGEHMVTEERTMIGMGDGGMHTRSVIHQESARSGDRVSLKYADWGSSQAFQSFLDEFDLEKCGTYTSRVHEDEDGELYGETENTIWCNRNTVVVTKCNPITGEGDPGVCGKHGYASATEITGDRQTLSWVETEFRRQRDYAPRYKDMYYYEDGEQITSDSGKM